MLIEVKLLKLSGFVIIRFPDLGPSLEDSSNGPEDAALLDEVCDPYYWSFIQSSLFKYMFMCCLHALVQ